MILLGVDDDGEVLGIDNHNRLKSEVQSIARSAEPPIVVEIESTRQVLCVRVPVQQGKPYSFGGKFFIREGASKFGSSSIGKASSTSMRPHAGSSHWRRTSTRRTGLCFGIGPRFRRRWLRRWHYAICT